MRKTPLRPGKGFSRRRQPVKRANCKRRVSEFARCYGSPERVAWVKSQPCVRCGAVGASENAHTENGGKGRKAGYETIVPLCGPRAHDCHRRYDQHLEPFDDAGIREFVKAYAAQIESRWRAHVAHVAGTPTQRSA